MCMVGQARLLQDAHLFDTSLRKLVDFPCSTSVKNPQYSCVLMLDLASALWSNKGLHVFVTRLQWDCIMSSFLSQPITPVTRPSCVGSGFCCATLQLSPRWACLTHYYESKSEIFIPSDQLLLSHWLISSLLIVTKGNLGSLLWAVHSQSQGNSPVMKIFKLSKM